MIRSSSWRAGTFLLMAGWGCGGAVYKLEEAAVKRLEKASKGHASFERDGAGRVVRADLREDQLYNGDLLALADLHGLRELRLVGSPWEMQVTDRSIPFLIGLPNLRMLVLENTLVTDMGVSEMRKARSDVEIDHRPGASAR